MDINHKIFGPKKGLLNRIKWAWSILYYDAKFWLEVRLWKLLRWLSPDDGRPCNTDQFLTVLLAECDDHYDRLEAIKAWLEGDWDEACDGLSIELKEPKP
jgi:hypothetical protein